MEVVNVGQGELRLQGGVKTPRAQPEPPQRRGDQQQDPQQPPEDQGLHGRNSGGICRGRGA